MKEIYFEAHEDKVDGGYTASAIGYGIHTQAETLEELRANILDAVDCYFGDASETPTVIHLRLINEEVPFHKNNPEDRESLYFISPLCPSLALMSGEHFQIGAWTTRFNDSVLLIRFSRVFSFAAGYNVHLSPARLLRP